MCYSFQSTLPARAVKLGTRDREQPRCLEKPVGFLFHKAKFLSSVVVITCQVQQAMHEQTGQFFDQGDLLFFGLDPGPLQRNVDFSTDLVQSGGTCIRGCQIK